MKTTVLPLTSDVVFHAVSGRDTEESNFALIGLFNIILSRKDDPITAVVRLNPIAVSFSPNKKTTIMDIKAETDRGRDHRCGNAGDHAGKLPQPRRLLFVNLLRTAWKKARVMIN